MAKTDAMTTFTSSSASVDIEGIVYIFLGNGVSRGRDEWQLSLPFFLILEALSQPLEQFLLLRYRSASTAASISGSVSMCKG